MGSFIELSQARRNRSPHFYVGTHSQRPRTGEDGLWMMPDSPCVGVMLRVFSSADFSRRSLPDTYAEGLTIEDFDTASPPMSQG